MDIIPEVTPEMMALEHSRNVAVSAQNLLQEWRNYARQLEARVRELDLALAVKAAHAGGLDAWVDAIKAESPSIPSFAPSRRHYKDRDSKSRGRLVYEAEFDRIAREHNTADPTQYRAD